MSNFKLNLWSKLKQSTALVLVTTMIFSTTAFAADANNYRGTQPRTIERAIYCLETEGQATLDGLVSIIETLDQGQQATLESILNELNSNNPIIQFLAIPKLGNFLESQANLTQEVINSIIAFLTNDNLLDRLRTCFRAPLDEVEPPVDPTITPTVVIAFVSSTSFTARINDSGDSPVTQKGFYYRESDLTADQNIILVNETELNGQQEYTSQVDLTCETEYTVQAFADNAAGVGFSNELTFTTNDCTTPTVETLNAIPGTEEATLRGSITNQGSSNVNEKGFQYKLSTQPDDLFITIQNDNLDLLEYASLVENLDCTQTYTYRAYAVNGIGIGTGQSVDFDCEEEQQPEDSEPTPEEECNALGGTLDQNGNCIHSPSPEEEACKDSGGTWENDQCTPPAPTQKQLCEQQERVWVPFEEATDPDNEGSCQTPEPTPEEPNNGGGGRNNGGSSSGSRINRPATNDDVILQSEETVELQSADLCQEFKDIETSWAKTEIETLRQMQVVCGRAPGQFVTEGETTRAEFSKIIVKTLKLEMGETEVPTFSDVASTDWFIAYINTLVSNNGINGNADGTFNPHNFITKEDLLAALRTLLPENLEWITQNIKFISTGEFVTRSEAAKIAMQVYELKK